MSWNPQQPQPSQYQQMANPNAPHSQPTKTAATSGKAMFSMILGFTSFCLALITGIPAVIFGFLAMRDIKNSQGRMGGQALAIVGIVCGSMGTLLVTAAMICVVPALLLPAVMAARDAAQATSSRQDLQIIGLAIHDYHDTYNRFPNSGVDDGNPAGGSGLSWRVHLLPFLDHKALYDRFRLDESWDSPHNMALLSEMPDVYASPGLGGSPSKTSYLAVVPGPNLPVGINTAILPEQPSSFGKIVDGASNTIIIVSADPGMAVEWTRPGDYPLDWNNPRHGLSNKIIGFGALYVDGASRIIGKDRSDEEVRAMMGANDGIPVF